MADTEAVPTPRNLVLCFDGTGDWIGSGKTNVAKLYAALDRESQATFYDGGIGTLNDDRSLTSTARSLRRAVDLGTASTLQQKVLNGYLFLAEHYRPGDRVFMFGFSRGAYTARLVASMIRDFGLLRYDARHLAPYLWQTMNRRVERSETDLRKREAWVDHELAFFDLRQEFCIPLEDTPGVHFMGLFDTVSSVGVVSRFDVHRHIEKNDWVLRVCHAVAMDEERNAFPELLFSADQPGLTEVWFPGVHRDVGGGTLDDHTIPDAALGWIALEAQREGLILRSPIPLYDPATAKRARPHPPVFDPYVFLGLYPMRIFVKRVDGFRDFWPNLRHTRPIPANAFVHEVAKTAPPDRATGKSPAHWPKHPVWFPEPGGQSIESRIMPLRERPVLSDLAAMLLLMPLVLMVAYTATGSLLGSTWPPGSARLVVWTAFLAVLVQGLGRPVYERLPSSLRPRGGWAVASVASLVLVYVVRRYDFRSWPLAYAGTVVGALFWGVSQLSLPTILTRRPPLPPLRMDRALGVVVRYLVRWTAVCLVVATANRIVHLAFPRLLPMDPVAWGWLVLLALFAPFMNGWNEILNDRRLLRRPPEPTQDRDSPLEPPAG